MGIQPLPSKKSLSQPPPPKEAAKELKVKDRNLVSDVPIRKSLEEAEKIVNDLYTRLRQISKQLRRNVYGDKKKKMQENDEWGIF